MSNFPAGVPAPSSKRRLGRHPGLMTWMLTLCLGTVAQAQVQSPIHRPNHGGIYPGATPSDADAATQAAAAVSPQGSAAANPVPAPAVPASLLEQPPKQAEIDAHANSLTIRADNASLTQTLQRIADKTGMHLEGISGDQRVFGDFGPGAPRDVLNTLLTGTGYNIVMIGALDNGAPRQLVLSQKKTAASTAAPAPQQQPSNPSEDDPGVDNSPSDDQPQQLAPPMRGGDATNGRGIRTPQQMLEQMQQMRQQADQQQPQQ